MELIPQKKLGQEFDVFGSFYNINLGNNRIIMCRNSLEIFSRKIVIESSPIIYKSIPNAVFVMLNPGSAQPVDNLYKIPEYQVNQLNYQLLKNNMVRTKPDRAQYQIMRVMKYKKWDCVRVINLSDIREANSDKFIEQYQIFENQTRTDIHSIFSYKRHNERERYALNFDENIPIILAWGINPKYIHLATNCLINIKGRNIKGISANLFYHASPQRDDHKIRWLENILEII